MGDPKGIGDLSKHDLQVITCIEETPPELLAHPHWLRFPKVEDADNSMAAQIQENLPVRIYRYGADADQEINETVLSLFRDERDRRLEAGEKITKGPFILQESLIEGFGTKEYVPKKEAKKFMPTVVMNVPHIFLVEGFGPDLYQYLNFYHNLVTWYQKDDFPSMFVLTEEGYKYFFGFQAYAGSGWADIYPNELPLPNGIVPSQDCYRLSRLGIAKR